MEGKKKPKFSAMSEREEEVLKIFSINQLIKFQKDMKLKSNYELHQMFGIDEDTVVYVKQNIRKLIKEKNQSARGRK